MFLMNGNNKPVLKSLSLINDLSFRAPNGVGWITTNIVLGFNLNVSKRELSLWHSG